MGHDRFPWVTGARYVFVGGCLTALAATAACQLLAGLGDRTLAIHDGGSDASIEDVVANPCSALGVPDRPDASSSANDSVTVTAALQDIDFGLDGGGYGFNLDRICTCPGNDSCIRNGDGGPACDVGEGVDIQGRQLFQFAENLQVIQEVQLNQALESGQSGALIRIDEWNGTPNDSQVRVSVFSSLGAASPPLAFDGGDLWSVQDFSVAGITDAGTYLATASVDSAYVVDGKVVATLDTDLPISVGSSVQSVVSLVLSSGVIVADIAQGSNGVYTLSGTLAGRWSMQKMLTSFQVFYDPLDSTQHLCGNDLSYQTVKQYACNLADIATNVLSDNTNAPCDAISIGLHFDAVSAQLGAIVPSPEAGTPCGPSYTDSCQP